MIDGKLLLKNFDEAAERLGRKGVEREELVKIRDLMVKRNQLENGINETKAQINKISKIIGTLMREENKEEDAERLKVKVLELKEQIGDAQKQLTITEEEIEKCLLYIPNTPDDEAPDGASEDNNVVLRYEGYDENAYSRFNYKPHWEIAQNLGILDQERAAKISGSMFTVLRKEGARLLRALIQFALNLNREKYEEIVAPHFVKTEVF
jgi:seryl-tRNA synthetase